MDILPIIAAVIFGILILKGSFRIFFQTKEDFYEAIGHCFTPDIISLFRGEWAEDQWNELKVFLWIAMGGLAAYCAYTLTESLLS